MVSTAASQPSRPFQAKYPPYYKNTTSQKIYLAVYNIFSTMFPPLGLFRIARHAIRCLSGLSIVEGLSNRKIRKNPSKRQFMINATKDYYSKSFKEVKEDTIKTPDGAELSILLFMAKNPPEESVITVIFFGGMYYYPAPLESRYDHELDRSIIEHAAENKYNVILINPRRVGINKDWPTPQRLALDAETVYQYVQEELKTKEENIFIYGHSFGGVPATTLAKEHPRAKLICDATFDKFSNAIYQSIIKKAKKISKNCFIIFLAKIIAKIASFIIRLIGWDLSPAKAYKECQNKKIIISRGCDARIPPKASLANSFKNDTILILQNKNHTNEISNTEFDEIFEKLN
jgi:hypothetical protein